MRPSLLTALVLLFLAALAGPALSAGERGTPAWTIKPLIVFEGPGTAYDVLGDVEGKIRIRVLRCTYQWCHINGPHVRGWVSRADLSFGQHPRGPFTGPRLNYPGGGPGIVCLYSGHDFTGDSICMKSGRVLRDLLLQDLDDRYSSVSIEGNVSVTLCRDRDFSSYCERVISSQPRLHGFLNNNVSSLRVH